MDSCRCDFRGRAGADRAARLRVRIVAPADAVTAANRRAAGRPARGGGGLDRGRGRRRGARGPPRLPAAARAVAPAGADLQAAAVELETCEQSRPRRLVLFVERRGARSPPPQPGLRSERYRSAGRNPIAGAWRELEALAAARLSGAKRIVLRPAPAAVRDGWGSFGRLLSRRVAIRAAGLRPAAPAPGARGPRRGGGGGGRARSGAAGHLPRRGARGGAGAAGACARQRAEDPARLGPDRS